MPDQKLPAFRHRQGQSLDQAPTEEGEAVSSHVPMTREEFENLSALSETVRVLGQIFSGGEASPEALRMGAGTLRASADVLEAIAARWEAQ
jgi:hypothetical protein